MVSGWLPLVSALPPGVGAAIIWCLVVMAATVLLGAAVLIVRRRFHPAAQEQDRQAGFSIDHLERMRDGGQISDEEFSSLRRATLGLDADGATGDNARSSGCGEDDDRRNESNR